MRAHALPHAAFILDQEGQLNADAGITQNVRIIEGGGWLGREVAEDSAAIMCNTELEWRKSSGS